MFFKFQILINGRENSICYLSTLAVLLLEEYNSSTICLWVINQ